MSRPFRLGALLLMAGAAACSKSPESPTSPTAPVGVNYMNISASDCPLRSAKLKA